MVGYIHTPGKHRRSGTTMQKMPGRGSLARANTLRHIHEGFPAKPFERVEDIEFHVDSDRIECLMCGRFFKTVLIHVRKIHQMDEGEYRDRFNIPARYALTGNATQEKLRENYRNLEDDEGIKSKTPKESNAPRRDRSRPRRPLVPLVKESWRAGIERMNSPEIRTSMREGKGQRLRDGGRGEWPEDEHAWHLEQIREHRDYRSLQPPAGAVGWSGFKKRRIANAALKAEYQAARRHYIEQRDARKRRDREAKAEATRIKWAQPRVHLRKYGRDDFDRMMAAMLAGRSRQAIGADPDMPGHKWLIGYLRENPDEAARLAEEMEKAPFAVQAHARMLGKRFVEAVRLERGKKPNQLSDVKIGKKLGVDMMTVNLTRRREGIA